MPTQLTLSGTIFEEGTKKPLSDETVKLKLNTQSFTTISDANGNFNFPPIDEPILQESQTKYTIYLYVNNKDGYLQEPNPHKIEIKKGTKTFEQDIKLVNRGTVSNRAGSIFLYSLIAILIAFISVYYVLHDQDKNNANSNVSSKVVKTLSSSLVDRITADSVIVGNYKVSNDTISEADSNYINAEYLQIKEAASELIKASQLDSAIAALINRNIVDLKQAIDIKKKEDIQVALTGSKHYIKQVPSFLRSWFWTNAPNSYFEILFWAFFATLLRLIGNTSFYVSRSIFFKNSIPHKVALLFTIPLIALLITFIISFFKISIAIGETSFVVDFSNPFVSIILASLIGLAPWKAWEFMYGVADQLFNSLKNWLGLNKKGDEKSEIPDADSNTQENAESAV